MRGTLSPHRSSRQRPAARGDGLVTPLRQGRCIASGAESDCGLQRLVRLRSTVLSAPPVLGADHGWRSDLDEMRRLRAVIGDEQAVLASRTRPPGTSSLPARGSFKAEFVWVLQKVIVVEEALLGIKLFIEALALFLGHKTRATCYQIEPLI